jgi:hypothetical protein
VIYGRWQAPCGDNQTPKAMGKKVYIFRSEKLIYLLPRKLNAVAKKMPIMLASIYNFPVYQPAYSSNKCMTPILIPRPTQHMMRKVI